VTYYEGEAHNHHQHPYILSADSSSVRIWNKNDGGNFTAMECPATINDFCVVTSGHNMTPPYSKAMSGLILLACEDPKGSVMFLPALGMAPRWCSFLDTLTEELDHASQTTVYQDYVFLSRPELAQLGLDDVALQAAKDVVRPVMHGYFVEEKFLTQLRAVVKGDALARGDVDDEESGAAVETARQRKERAKDPITPALARRRKLKKDNNLTKSEDGVPNVDPRFQRHMSGQDKAMFEMDPKGATYAARRDALHRSLFATEGVDAGGLARLKDGADFHQNTGALVQRRNEERRKSDHSLAHRAKSLQEKAARKGEVEIDGRGNITAVVTREKKRSKAAVLQGGEGEGEESPRVSSKSAQQKPERRKFKKR